MRTPKSPSYKSGRGKNRKSGGVSFPGSEYFSKPAPIVTEDPEPTLDEDQYAALVISWNRQTSIGAHVIYSNKERPTLRTTTESDAFIYEHRAWIRLNGLSEIVALECLTLAEVEATK